MSRIGINFALFEGVEDQEDEADAEDDLSDVQHQCMCHRHYIGMINFRLAYLVDVSR